MTAGPLQRLVKGSEAVIPRRALDAPHGLARVLAILGDTLLTLLVAVAVTLALLVTFGGYHITRVLSDSMYPTFAAGDYVILQDRPLAELETGQVVVLPNPNSSTLYIHRLTSVVRAGGDVFVNTKGDNNPAGDAWTLELTSPTIPVYVATLPTHSLDLPVFSAATGQILLAAGLALLSILLLLPHKRDLPRRSRTTERVSGSTGKGRHAVVGANVGATQRRRKRNRSDMTDDPALDVAPQVAGLIAERRDEIARRAAQELTETDRERLPELLHRLAGKLGSFGHVEAGDAARDLLRELNQNSAPIDLDERIAHIVSLLRGPEGGDDESAAGPGR